MNPAVSPLKFRSSAAGDTNRHGVPFGFAQGRLSASRISSLRESICFAQDDNLKTTPYVKLRASVVAAEEFADA
jgi:hypothetical protein